MGVSLVSPPGSQAAAFSPNEYSIKKLRAYVIKHGLPQSVLDALPPIEAALVEAPY